MIAANSEGAMRDAQSILDRCISFNSQVDYETVVSLLGAVNYRLILEAAEALVDRDIKRTMSLVDHILSSGKELTVFLDELIICFRNMLIIKATNSSDNLMRISEDEAHEIMDLNKKINLDDLVRTIEDLSTAQAECKKALNPRVLLETKLIKMLARKTEAGPVRTNKAQENTVKKEVAKRRSIKKKSGKHRVKKPGKQKRPRNF